MSVLSKHYFHDETAAITKLESILWPNGPVCPHCGGFEKIYELRGETTRIGLKKCGQCRKQFTVKVGTVFESSHVPLHKWLQVAYLMCASKKGVSSHQIHRLLGVTYKTAWFMTHRLREAMRSGDLTPFGQFGGPVEVDETFIGNDPDYKRPNPKSMRSVHDMNKVLTLIDRDSGRARSVVIDDLTMKTIVPIVGRNVSREAWLMTDEAHRFTAIGPHFAAHGVVNHSADEYVSRWDRRIHTNTIEGYFSIFKRGMKGVYQHCSKKHLHRYLAEFDFRYSNRVAFGIEDERRMEMNLRGVMGKRLTYAKSTSKR